MGLSQDEAVKKLNNAGYKTIQIVTEKSSKKEGTVIKQSPSYSSAPNVDTTTIIVLTVAASDNSPVVKPEPTVPDTTASGSNAETQVNP